MAGSLLFLLAGAGYLDCNTGYSTDTWNNQGPGIFPLTTGKLMNSVCMGFIVVIASPPIFEQITTWPLDRATVLFRALA